MKDTKNLRVTDVLSLGSGAVKKLDSKTVRMAADVPSERKSIKSHKTTSEADPYEHKTVDDVIAEMDRCNDQIERLFMRIKQISDNKLKSKGTVKKEKQPLLEEIAMLREKVAYLDKVRDNKIPFYEKLNKDSNFYKHFISNMYTNRFRQTTAETIKNEEQMLHEVAEIIPKVRISEKDTKTPKKKTQREIQAEKSLWQEMSA